MRRGKGKLFPMVVLSAPDMPLRASVGRPGFDRSGRVIPRARTVSDHSSLRLTLPRTVLCAALLLVIAPLGSLGQDGAEIEQRSLGSTTHVSVTGRGTVEMHVADQPLSTVLQLLSIEARRNIIASPQVQGTVTADLYDATFDEALEAILLANGAGYRTVGKFTYVYTLAELERMAADAGEKPTTQVFRLSYIRAADAETYVSPLLDEDESMSVSPSAPTGLSSEATEGGGNASPFPDFIVITARPRKLREIGRILAEIDVRPRQVLVEATILRAALTDENSLGIDFTIVGGVDLQLLGAVSHGVQDLALGLLPDDRFEDFNANLSTDLASNVPDGGMTLGIIKDQVGVFLRALEQVTDTTVLANPKILSLNRQKGQVIVGRRDGYLTTTVTETQAVQTVEFLETGTQLIFRPFIGEDGWVRVELHPEDSVGFVNAQGLPSEQTTEVTANVMIRDGETILIGGLFREVTTDARSQVPGLGNIPVIGQFFRSNNDSSSREEVIILLTIHIVKDQDAYVAASARSREDIERMRVGMRQGLMWHGRERMAESHYRKALDRMRRGDSDKALWHTRMALHNNPRHARAIELKERILGERAWDEDATTTRDFIHNLIARERGLPSRQYARPDPTSVGADAVLPETDDDDGT